MNAKELLFGVFWQVYELTITKYKSITIIVYSIWSIYCKKRAHHHKTATSHASRRRGVYPSKSTDVATPFDKLPSHYGAQIPNIRALVASSQMKSARCYDLYAHTGVVLSMAIARIWGRPSMRYIYIHTKSSTMQADNYFVIYILMNTQIASTATHIQNANNIYTRYTYSRLNFA